MDKFIPVKGFKACGLNAGIKKNGAYDLSLIVADDEAIAAGVFTTNQVKAAPLKHDIKALTLPKHKALLVNSGNANACTGAHGEMVVESCITALSSSLDVDKNQILLSSTGIIGVPLPYEKILDALPSAIDKLSEDGFIDAATGILTTDTAIKVSSIQFDMNGTLITLSGMAKGSGMIHPNMATMLGYVFTDVNINKALFTKALKASINETFNMISVDGDTSTNDSVIVFSSCKADNPCIESEDENYDAFAKALKSVCESLAKKIASDGEGATKLIEVQINNAINHDQAMKLAKGIIGSNLVKSAFFGSDANWGRILCAMGYSGAEFDDNLVDLYFSSDAGRIQLVQAGCGLDFDESLAKDILTEHNVFIEVFMNAGDANIKAWGCDLSYDYIKINGSYKT